MAAPFFFLLGGGRLARRHAEAENVADAVGHLQGDVAGIREDFQRAVRVVGGGDREEAPLGQRLRGLVVDFADPQVGGHRGRLSLHVDDLQVFQRRLQRVEVGDAYFLVGRHRPGDHFFLRFIEVTFLDEFPGLLSRGRIENELPLERLHRLQRHLVAVRRDADRRDGEGIVLDFDLLQVHRVEIQQVGLDPILEPHRELGGVELDNIHQVLVGKTHVVQIGLVGHRLADDRGNKLMSGGVLHRHARADAGVAELDLLRIGIDDPEAIVCLAEGRRIHGRRPLAEAGGHAENRQPDQRVGRRGQMFLGVSRIIAVRRYHPQALLFGNFQLERLAAGLVVAKDLQAVRRLPGP